MKMRLWTFVAGVEGLVALIAGLLGWGMTLGLGILSFSPGVGFFGLLLAALFVPLGIWAVVREGRRAWPLAVIALSLVLVNGLAWRFLVAVTDSCAHGVCP